MSRTISHMPTTFEAKLELDFAIDPAHDLVIEVDVSRSSIGKLPIVAALHVPEVWQYRGDAFRIFALDGEASAETGVSNVLTNFPVEGMISTLSQRMEIGETQLIASSELAVEKT